jgi:RNA recognition motif-containing protein
MTRVADQRFQPLRLLISFQYLPSSTFHFVQLLTDNLINVTMFCQGTAEVVFARRSDALAALKRYNNVQLDGKPMKIEFIGTNIAAQAPAIFTLNTPALGNFNFPPRRLVPAITFTTHKTVTYGTFFFSELLSS